MSMECGQIAPGSGHSTKTSKIFFKSNSHNSHGLAQRSVSQDPFACRWSRRLQRRPVLCTYHETHSQDLRFTDWSRWDIEVSKQWCPHIHKLGGSGTVDANRRSATHCNIDTLLSTIHSNIPLHLILVTDLMSRMMGTWTFTSAIVRIYTAYNISNKT
jgi:hypothetical protein